MVLSRVIAVLMISAAGAVQAQQAPSPAATQSAPPTASKADNGDKVTCRIHMDANLPRRVCMTNSQWKKVDAQSHDNNQSYVNRFGCSGATGSAAGAC